MKITVGSRSDTKRLNELKRLGLAETIRPYIVKRNGHSFEKGRICELHGLVDYPEFNGTLVKIDEYRRECDGEKCYYVTGKINKFLDWVFEKRLKTLDN